MIKYFELLLDLLEIPETARTRYIDIANVIEQGDHTDIICYHKHALVFEGYKKLLNKEITTEEFTYVGDINSKILFDTKKQDSISFLKSNPVLDENILYIFDDLARGIVVEEHKNIIYC